LERVRNMRIGFGYDSHRLVSGRKLILGGVEIPHDKGSWGHSDADALVHAVCDAILGAIAAGDIGRHFPDNDQNYKDISSLILLQNVVRLTDDKALQIHNVDCTIILEKPKLVDYTTAMAANIAGILRVPPEMVNIKAKTNEGMGLVGSGEGVAAFAVVTVREKSD
jgi:2-C-methyl-D-erythritol 2,4-cyclodiphosphate synthase